MKNFIQRQVSKIFNIKSNQSKYGLLKFIFNLFLIFALFEIPRRMFKTNIENYEDCKCKNGLSLVCPHAGCIVEEDKEKKEFVCPCHGSRFALKDGKLLEGPAETGLKKCGCKK